MAFNDEGCWDKAVFINGMATCLHVNKCNTAPSCSSRYERLSMEEHVVMTPRCILPKSREPLRWIWRIRIDIGRRDICWPPGVWKQSDDSVISNDRLLGSSEWPKSTSTSYRSVCKARNIIQPISPGQIGKIQGREAVEIATICPRCLAPMYSSLS